MKRALSSVVICTRSATKIKIATREPPSFARKLHEFPRDISAEYHALPHGTIICASGSYFFVFDMSFFVLKMKTHVSY